MSKKEYVGWDQPISTELPHARPEGLDPRKNGPFLDDIRADQERAYREARQSASSEAVKKAKEEEEALAQAKKDAEEAEAKRIEEAEAAARQAEIDEANRLKALLEKAE